MLRRVLALTSAMLIVCLCGCADSLPATETTQYDEYMTTTVVLPETTVEITTEEAVATEAATTLPEETTQEQTTQPPVTEALTTQIMPEESTSAQAEETTTAVVFTEVDLSVSMPEKNGTMVTDTSYDNKYIRIVCDKRGIDKELLVAVYAVPESGQNYVFEFYDVEDFTAENIRRVFLIDSDGAITGVAATKSSERENVSAVENWFCMNVLIKELIFPAVSDNIV